MRLQKRGVVDYQSGLYMSYRHFKMTILIIFAFGLMPYLFPQAKKEANEVNGSIIEIINKDNHTLRIRKHEQKLTLDYAANDFNLILYDDPIEKTKISDLQRKQKITIEQIVFLDEKETWLKIQVDDKHGYIFFGEGITDPYKDDRWMPTGTIQSGAYTYHILKYETVFNVDTNLRIRDKPGLGGKKIGLIIADKTNWASVKTFEVTKEKETIDNITERWAKIEYNGITGWVFAGYLRFERGGSRFHTPDIDFIFGLETAP